jgi:hypothetical protein
MLTITLSGPPDSELDAAAALLAAGFADVRGDRNTLPAEPGTAYLTCEGEDIDAAHAAVEPFGWRLRMHTQAKTDAVVMPVVAFAETGGQG